MLAFDQSRILEVEITMAPEDYDAMRRQSRRIESVFGGECGEAPPESPYTWFVADVTVDGTTVLDVGVRKKGFFGSPSTTKPALKIKFNEYGSNDRIYGLDRMTLNNSIQDPSLLDMCLAYDTYIAAGQKASRCSYAHVTINSQDHGIYMHVESIKEQFLAANYGSADGALYEGSTADFRENWLGVFEFKNEAAQGAELDAVTAALLMADDAEFQEALWAVVDKAPFMKAFALAGMLGDWDGYFGGANNFWIYKNPETGLLEFLPWSNDDLFGRGSPFATLLDTSDAPLVFTSSALANRLWGIEEIRMEYQQVMESLFEQVWDEGALVATLQAREALISPIAGDLSEASAATQAWIERREATFAAAFAGGPPEERASLQPKECTILAGNLDFSFENTYEDPLSQNPVAPFGSFDVNDFSLTSWPTGTLDASDLAITLEVQVGKDNMLGADKLVLRAIALHNVAASLGLVFNLTVDQEEALEALGTEVEVSDAISSFLLHLNAGPAPLPFLFPLGFVADTTLRLDQADFTNGGTVSGNYRSSLLTFNGHPFMDADVDGWSDFDEKFCGADGLNPLISPVDTDSDGNCNALDADDDGDGYSDAEELQAGTDPLDASVHPVPEPAAFLLSLTALLTLAGLRRFSSSRQ
ncbi:MAG: CotH kinase family protein [Polyangiaceae bacterium]